MQLEKRILRRVKKHRPGGGMAHTAKIFLSVMSIRHPSVKAHSERGALLAEAVAKKLKKDDKAAFFAMLFHDFGKLFLPCGLFDGHDINADEYKEVKEHAIIGYSVLKDFHLFAALCAGLHHSLYDKGYGLTQHNFPKGMSPKTIKKVLEIATIVSICDFIDSYTHRKTTIKDGSDEKANGLRGMLLEKYPNDHAIVDVALKANKALKL